MSRVPDRAVLPDAGTVLILAPAGRDAVGAQQLLVQEGIGATVCATLAELENGLDQHIGAVLVTDEALINADLHPLRARLRDQPAWSDLPFVVLTQRNVAARRVLAQLHLPEALGNVMFLERPLNVLTLISSVRTALRARLHQLQIREHLGERSEAAAALQQLNHTLEARVRERTEALRASEAALAQAQKMEAVGRLTGGIAHDFNNLLTGIVGSLELLQRRLGQDERAAALARGAFDAAMRGARLTGQLLAFSRTQQLDLRPVDLNGVLDGMGELLARTVGPMIEVRVRPGAELPPAVADGNQFELALLNLAINARDAMEAGGVLTITTAAEMFVAADGVLDAGRYVAVTVSDTGSGMTPEVLARATEPFFTTKPVGKGTGLGLAQVYGITRQSGGDVRITSTPGEGTSVRILLPVASAALRIAALPVPLPPQPAEPQPGGSVLIVDDDAAVRGVFAAGLEALGFRVHTACDGPAALRVLEQGAEIHAAVLDFAMPGMNGAAVAAAALRLRPGLPILFASGYADTAALANVDGATVLRKPIQIAELARELRSTLGRRRAVAAG